MAKEGAGEFVGDRCNHTAVFAQENKRTSIREENIRGSVSNIGPCTIRVLFFVPLGNDRVWDRRTCLVAFDVDTYQAMLVKRDSGHPFWFGVRVKYHSNCPCARVPRLICFPLWNAAAASTGHRHETHGGAKAPFQRETCTSGWPY